jgi:hypothetical protein
LSDDIIRIIYNYIRDTIIKDGNGVWVSPIWRRWL